MKTVGQLLKTAREKKGLTIQEVEKATKIRTQYVEFLETDQYHKLPSGTYAKGFIKNYAQFLNLPVDTSLAVFRRDFTENQQGQIVPRSMTSPLSDKKFIWTPKTSLISIITILILIVLGFVYYQYQSLTHPKLEVTIPIENEILLGPTITVAGFADPSSVISVNGQLAAIDSNGEFSTNITLQPGLTEIIIEASNNYGHKTTVTRVVDIRPPD